MTISPPFFTDHGLNLELGERVFINQNCTFLDYAGIRLAPRVMIAPRVTFITVGHPVDVEDRRSWLTGGPIDVAENVWIGAGATILPGVSIGRDAVIAPARRPPTTCRPGRWWRGRRGGWCENSEASAARSWPSRTFVTNVAFRATKVDIRHECRGFAERAGSGVRATR